MLQDSPEEISTAELPTRRIHSPAIRRKLALTHNEWIMIIVVITCIAVVLAVVALTVSIWVRLWVRL